MPVVSLDTRRPAIGQYVIGDPQNGSTTPCMRQHDAIGIMIVSGARNAHRHR